MNTINNNENNYNKDHELKDSGLREGENGGEEFSETDYKDDSSLMFQKWDDESINLNPHLLRGIYAFGFEQPSPIQQKSIIPVTKMQENGFRRDTIAQAQSGSGKTGAFAISALNIINIKNERPQVLILSPTHELATQSLNVVKSIGKYLNVKTQLLVGGTSVEQNKRDLDERPPHIVVGTPGRVHDMIRRKFLKTDDISTIIVDEADEMLSFGFKDQMFKIFQFMDEKVQICLFSATFDKDLHIFSKKFLRNPYKILVKNEMLTLQGIAQYYIKIENDEQKYNTLKDLFSSLSISQAIIYCNSTKRVDDLEEAMIEDNFPVKKIHGKMDEKERKEVYHDFKKGSCRVLISSDLFARGIDVQQVSIVINFDIPKNEHTYLHRIGRSGRWGRKGIAINFLTRYDLVKLRHFEKYYNTIISEMPMNYTQHLGY